jgi:hypothetical protein
MLYNTYELLTRLAARLYHQFSLFGNRKCCYRRERMNVKTKQYFVFDNVANPREYILIAQRATGQLVRDSAHLFQCQRV